MPKKKFGGTIRVLALPPKNIYSLPNFVSFFCYAPKRPSPFFLYIPHKKPSINDNAVTIDPVTVKIANWLLIRQPEQ